MIHRLDLYIGFFYGLVTGFILCLLLVGYSTLLDVKTYMKRRLLNRYRRIRKI